jgi:hypothetical protein
VQHPGTHTHTVVLQQLQGGFTHSVVSNGGGGQQQGLPAWALSLTIIEPAASTTAKTIRRNMFNSPLWKNNHRPPRNAHGDPNTIGKV